MNKITLIFAVFSLLMIALSFDDNGDVIIERGLAFAFFLGAVISVVRDRFFK